MKKLRKWLVIAFFLFPFCIFCVAPPFPRRSVAPYLSGDTFRTYCDHAFDNLTGMNPALVKPGEIVFVRGNVLEQFFSYVHPEIPCKYILVSNTADDFSPGSCRKYLDDEKLLAWFNANPDGTTHPKLHSIPLGLENFHWKPYDLDLIFQYKARQLPKIHLLYCNFEPSTFPQERNYVLSLFANAPFTYYKKGRNALEYFEPYIRDIASSKFVLCPRGNGLDTHRLWEVLYTGSYPIIKKSPLDSLVAGLPVVIVSDWTEITEEFLNQKYEELQNTTFNLEKLQADFWFKWIDSYKRYAK